ncbi:MAG: hypothetical protein ACREPR_13905 [Brasilonema sp.]
MTQFKLPFGIPNFTTNRLEELETEVSQLKALDQTRRLIINKFVDEIDKLRNELGYSKEFTEVLYQKINKLEAELKQVYQTLEKMKSDRKYLDHEIAELQEINFFLSESISGISEFFEEQAPNLRWLILRNSKK